MDLNAGQLTRRIFSGFMHWTNGAYEESWTFDGTNLSEMPTCVALHTSHHFHPSLSPVASLSLGILHEWMKMQMLAKPSSNRRCTKHSNKNNKRKKRYKFFLKTFVNVIKNVTSS